MPGCERYGPSVYRSETQEQAIYRERAMDAEFSDAQEQSQSEGLRHER